jgi:uncharacterized protein YndB with AHSA1/START domain
VVDSHKAVFRILINGSQEAIFRELTKTDAPQGAVFNAMLTLPSPDIAVGKQMQMRTVSGRHTVVFGEILEYDPPHRFAHTHHFAQHDDPVCTVIYDLKRVADGVEVTLTVENIPLGTRTATAMQKGGTFILANLKSIVETGRPTLGARLMYVAFGAMEFMLPKRTRVENHPLRDA